MHVCCLQKRERGGNPAGPAFSAVADSAPAAACCCPCWLLPLLLLPLLCLPLLLLPLLWLPLRLSLLKVELSSLGALKTLPYLMMFLMSNAGGWAGDWVINVRRRSVAAGRKLVNTAGFWSAAVALMLMAGARGACCRCCCVCWGA